MHRYTAATLISSALLLAPPTFAAGDAKAPAPAMPAMTAEQQAEMEAYMKAGTPGEPHKAMAAEVGSYTTKVLSWYEPGKPPTEATGTATRTMALEGRVLVEDFASSMMGRPFTGQGRSGYDNVTGKYWSTWTDSMSTGIMVSEGSCDAQRVCTFKGSWNDPIKKAPVTARMSSRWTGPKTQIFEMFAPGKDGKEAKMMEITYTKK